MLRLLTACILALLACSACQSPATPDRAEVACTLVILRTGPRTEPLSKEESRNYFGGHFANMQRLAKQGDLLLAGPYGEHKSANDLRGIFLLKTADRERARELAATDPCFQAGIFRCEFHDLRTTFPLYACQTAELERVAAAEREGKQLPPGSGCRSYVMITITQHARSQVLANHASVYLLARLNEDRAIAFLDCQNQDEAETLLAPLREQLGEVTIDEWFGTDLLAQM